MVFYHSFRKVIKTTSKAKFAFKCVLQKEKVKNGCYVSNTTFSVMLIPTHFPLTPCILFCPFCSQCLHTGIWICAVSIYFLLLFSFIHYNKELNQFKDMDRFFHPTAKDWDSYHFATHCLLRVRLEPQHAWMRWILHSEHHCQMSHLHG